MTENVTETVKQVGHEVNMKAGQAVDKVLEQVEKVSDKAYQLKDEMEKEVGNTKVEAGSRCRVISAYSPVIRWRT